MGERTYFPTMANQEDIKSRIGTSGDGATDNPTTLFGGVKGILNKFTSIWTAARAAKLDNIQTVLNTPDGNTLAAWINAVNTNAASANTYAQQAVNSANNAYNIANQANQNAIAAKNAVNIVQSAGGHYKPRADWAENHVILNKEISQVVGKGYVSLGTFTPKKSGVFRIIAQTKALDPSTQCSIGITAYGDHIVGPGFVLNNGYKLSQYEYVHINENIPVGTVIVTNNNTTRAIVTSAQTTTTYQKVYGYFYATANLPVCFTLTYVGSSGMQNNIVYCNYLALSYEDGGTI